jgi:7 transmembrane receptor (rhodopsin family)
MGDVVKGRPPLRWEDVDGNTSLYDRTVAAPSDEVLVQMWISWSVVTAISAIFAAVLFFGILCSKRARRQSFNAYLLYLTLPDLVFAFLCTITCIMNAIRGQFWSAGMCNFQAYYSVVGIGSNLWLSAAITYEIHRLLRYSRQRRRYYAPTRRTVALQATAAYLYCGLLGTLVYVDEVVDNFPFHVASPAGAACIPTVGPTLPSQLFFSLFFIPIYAGLPVVYILVVAVDIHRRRLIPPPGKRRTLTVYFGRMIVVIIVMWIPFLLAAYIIGPWSPRWLMWSGGTASHFQAVISVIIALLKPDVRLAVVQLLTCRCTCFTSKDNDDSDHRRHQQSSDPFDTTMMHNSTWWRHRSSIRSIMIGMSSKPSSSDFRVDNNHITGDFSSSERHLGETMMMTSNPAAAAAAAAVRNHHAASSSLEVVNNNRFSTTAPPPPSSCDNELWPDSPRERLVEMVLPTLSSVAAGDDDNDDGGSSSVEPKHSVEVDIPE